MAKRLGVVVLWLLAPRLAFAGVPAAPPPDSSAEPAAVTPGGSPVGQQQRRQEVAPATMVPEAPPGQMSPNGQYTIRRGDTLWDLSQRFLDNPWYWPKIWADNPGIANPHWIYPGNSLLIRTSGAGLPGEVEPAAAGVPGPGKRDIADLAAERLGHLDNLGQDADLVTAAGRLGFRPPPMRVQVASLITREDLASSGVVVGSFEPKSLLTTYDRVYLRFPDLAKVHVGETFSVFRPGPEVIHPLTGQSFGYRTKLIGTVRVLGKDRGLAVGEIGEVMSSVERGDRLGPPVKLTETVTPVANTRELSGVILATEVPHTTWSAEEQVVFLDKGARDGVERGNTFVVVQAGDGLDEMALGGRTWSRTLPREVVAQLMVFDVREDASAAVVVKSLREVGIGDEVEMHPTVPLPGAGGDAR